MKKVFCYISALLLLCVLPSNSVNSAEPESLNFEITVSEESIEDESSIGNGYTVYAKIQQENLGSVSLLRTGSVRRRLTSQLQIKNPLGMTIATLTAVGTFDTNGSTSKDFH